MPKRLKKVPGVCFPGEASDEFANLQNALIDACQDTKGAPASKATLDPVSDEVLALLEQWPAQDQGDDRATCVPFSVLAMIEFLERVTSTEDHFKNYSEEFLYSKMRREHKPDPLPINYHLGTTFMDQAAGALETSGICSESAMPYIARASDPALTRTPSPQAEAEALTNLFPKGSFTYQRLLRKHLGKWKQLDVVKIIRGELKAGNPVAVSFPIYRGSNQWTNPYCDGWRFGDVQDPAKPDHVVDIFEDGVEREVVNGGHAVCIVGFIKGSGQSDGRFLFKNSWGNRFARQHAVARVPAPRSGYGTVSTAHVQNHCWELMYKTRSKAAAAANTA